MTKFHRSGHWRTNAYGTTYWVSGHEVSRYDWSGSPSGHVPSSFWPSIAPTYRTSGSYTTPNATCPVCGAQVYFYRSPDDGRVFFDDLGPPWPKHPCTDNPCSPSFSWRSASTARRPASSTNSAWQREGWEPFASVEVRQLPTMSGWFRLKGTFRGQGREFFVQRERQPSSYIFHAREHPIGQFQIGFIEVSPNGSSSSHELEAHLHAPQNSGTSKVTASSANSASDIGPRTAFADAYLRAQRKPPQK